MFVVLKAWRKISDIFIHRALLDKTSTVKPNDYITANFFGHVRFQFQLPVIHFFGMGMYLETRTAVQSSLVIISKS